MKARAIRSGVAGFERVSLPGRVLSATHDRSGQGLRVTAELRRRCTGTLVEHVFAPVEWTDDGCVPPPASKGLVVGRDGVACRCREPTGEGATDGR